MTNIQFNGGFWEFFFVNIGLLLLTVLTLGLAAPYLIYWSTKYFFTNLQVGPYQTRFTGSFGGYFLKSLGLLILSVVTLGLLLPYYSYWNIEYFAANLEVAGDIR